MVTPDAATIGRTAIWIPVGEPGVPARVVFDRAGWVQEVTCPRSMRILHLLIAGIPVPPEQFKRHGPNMNRLVLPGQDLHVMCLGAGTVTVLFDAISPAALAEAAKKFEGREVDAATTIADLVKDLEEL